MMFRLKLVSLMMLIPLGGTTQPYLLRSYPTESTVVQSSFTSGPCIEPVKTLPFLQNTDEESLYHSECMHNADESVLTCKLGLGNSTASLNLDEYPLKSIIVVVLFVQEFPETKIKPRVLDLCFLNRFGESFRELAICGYKPSISGPQRYPYLHILDVPALAIVASNVETLLISGVNLWQSVELRQFSSLKHLLIIQGATIQMRYFHSPFCADCEDAHPREDYSFHYLIPLSSQLTYFLYDSAYTYTTCKYDLLKEIRSRPSKITTFIVASQAFHVDVDKTVCQTCESGLCPLLAVCLDATSNKRRNAEEPFECLCVEEVAVADEFQPCKPMTVHPPMYSTRCDHTPSIWNYVTPLMITLGSYLLCSTLAFIGSTIFLRVTKPWLY